LLATIIGRVCLYAIDIADSQAGRQQSYSGSRQTLIRLKVLNPSLLHKLVPLLIPLNAIELYFLFLVFLLFSQRMLNSKVEHSWLN
jgi:hypothetical protein